MNSLPFKEIEFVGFNGTVLSSCGRTLAVALHQPTGRYFKFNFFGQDKLVKPTILFTKQEIEDFKKEARITLLRKPIHGFPRAMMMYVKKDFIEAFGLNHPKRLCKSITWQKLDGLKDAWAACAPADVIERCMNEWSAELRAKANALIIRYLSEGLKELRDRAERITALALCAARDPSLRSNIYLIYGAAILLSETPERLQNLHRYIVKPQFPGWEWNIWLDEIKRFIDVLRTKTAVLDKIPLFTGAVEGRPKDIVHGHMKLTPSKLIEAVASSDKIELPYTVNIFNFYSETLAPTSFDYKAMIENFINSTKGPITRKSGRMNH